MWWLLVPAAAAVYYIFKEETKEPPPARIPAGLIPAQPNAIPASFISRIRISRTANFDSKINAKVGDIVDTDEPFPTIRLTGQIPGQVIINSSTSYTLAARGLVLAAYLGLDGNPHKTVIDVL